ncbi:aminomethyltransferase [Actinobaculum suis]|uniref:Aminomethyltransferase n=2 Tax=Actinobaculum suis TaxID=1657 RepID=A0A1G7E6M0_9ACTO|nr:glycine cleavage system aminomethyltransferase GcvT [Actinobaculum suis]SDE59283.1 aminomethyltransferase [Actinobaculum suis]
MPEITTGTAELRTTPLYARHQEAGATFTDFGGWKVPVRFTSDLAEHKAVRQAAGLFDVSHMGEIEVRGPDALAFLNYALAGNFTKTRPGRAKYTFVLNARGGIIDDLIVFRLAADAFLLIPNAANRAAVLQALRERAGQGSATASGTASDVANNTANNRDGVTAGTTAATAGGAGANTTAANETADTAEAPTTHPSFPEVTITDLSDQSGLLALQGPLAAEILAATAGFAPHIPLSEMRYYSWQEVSLAGISCFLSRTGYTGEDGFEIMAPAADIGTVWDALIAAGEPRGLLRAGFGARDSLRLEAGMPLYGHELGPDIFPAQAGLGRLVVGTENPATAPESAGVDKSSGVATATGSAPGTAAGTAPGTTPPATPPADYPGTLAALAAGEAQTKAPTLPVLVGLRGEGRRAARAGYEVFAADRNIGHITSGVLSPILGYPIAMAYIDPAFAGEGTEISVDIRGKQFAFTVTTLPFYKRK